MNNNVNSRIEDLKKKARILVAVIAVSIVALIVLTIVQNKTGKGFFLIPIPLLALFGSLFCCILLYLKNQGLRKTVNYYASAGGKELLSKIDLSSPVYTSASILNTRFNLYDGGEAFFLDDPGIAVRYADIATLCAFRNNSDRNAIHVAAVMQTPLTVYDNGSVEITDRSNISMKLKDGTVFGTCSMGAEDATFFTNFLLKKNPAIQWLGEARVGLG